MILLALLLGLYFAFVAVSLWVGQPYATLIQECIGRPDISPNLLSLCFVVSTMNVLPLGSLIISLLVVIRLKKKIAQLEPERENEAGAKPKSSKNIVYTVPMKSLVLSALLSLAPMAIMTIIMFAGLVEQPKASVIATFFILIVAAVRCPITARLTLVAKAEKDVADKARRQQLEREHALRARMERENSTRYTMVETAL